MNQDESRYLTRTDPTVIRVSESALRLMAGQVPKATLAELRRRVEDQQAAGFPWEAVVDQINSLPVETKDLLSAGLRAQRDWIVRGGRETPGRPLRYHAKKGAAYVVSRLLLALLYILGTVALLLLAKQKWPGFDIYAVLTWLQKTLPGLFPPR